MTFRDTLDDALAERDATFIDAARELHVTWATLDRVLDNPSSNQALAGRLCEYAGLHTLAWRDELLAYAKRQANAVARRKARDERLSLEAQELLEQEVRLAEIKHRQTASAPPDAPPRTATAQPERQGDA